MLGMDKINLFNNPADFTIYTGAALSQGAIAAYGSYIIGKSTQVYLQQGCSWAPLEGTIIGRCQLNKGEITAIAPVNQQEIVLVISFDSVVTIDFVSIIFL